MSHPQAYHTSCRAGLSGAPGFQFNAASPELSPQALRALAEAHAGYTAPRDSPLEPSIEDLAAFPVALKHRPVDGIGAVVSRTAYVGREFRGRNGEPDTGRFGNYFSHIVAGGSGDDPFDGLLPVELWGSPHWTTAEASDTALEELPQVSPGNVDLDAILGRFDDRRRPWLAPVLDSALAALFKGPRAVVVEPDPARAADWVGWVSFALPTEFAQSLTFTTFDGRPRFANDVQFCVTTPGCDIGFTPQELGRSAVLIDPFEGGPPPAKVSLYARTAAAIAERGGAEAVAMAVRGLSTADSPDRLGAELALRSGHAGLVAAEELPDALAVLQQMIAGGEWALADRSAGALPAPVEDASVIRGWGEVHRLARSSTTTEAQGVAGKALEALLPALGPDTLDLPQVAPGAPTSPSPRLLAAWLQRLDEAPDGGSLLCQLEAGLTLGLVGSNAALDRRIGAKLGAALPDPGARRAYERLAAEPLYRDAFDAATGEIAVRAAADDAVYELLRELVAHEVRVREGLREYVEGDGGFDARVLWERLRVARDAPSRPVAVRNIVQLTDADGRAAAVVRSLYGPSGPQAPGEYAELLAAYETAGADVPPEDLDGALTCIANTPLDAGRDTERLVKAACRTDPALTRDPVIVAWKLAARPPSGAVPIEVWAKELRSLAASDSRRAGVRARELATVAATATVTRHEDHGYGEAVAALASTLSDSWPEEVGHQLERALAATTQEERLVARLFEFWRRLRGVKGELLLEEALPLGIQRWNRRRIEAVSEELRRESDLEAWEEWVAEHPPAGVLSRSVKRVVKRGER